MSAKISFEEIKKYFEDYGFQVIDENRMDGSETKISIMDNDGYKYFLCFHQFRHMINFGGIFPEKFIKSNIYTIDNIKLWILLNNKPYVFHHGEYTNNQDKNLFFQCNKCLETWNAQWSVIENGVGCPYCGGKRVGKFNNLGFMRLDLVDEWDYDKNYPLTPFDVFPRSKKRIWWKCHICSCSWNTILSNRTGKNPKSFTNCPNCRKSSGETLIKNFLDSNNISYNAQKVFLDCKYKKFLSFDFFISGLNICIEYQGEQHYFPVNFGNMEKILSKHRYDEQIKKDKIKLEYCKNKNIGLLILPYWDFRNIEKILYANLCKNKII